MFYDLLHHLADRVSQAQLEVDLIIDRPLRKMNSADNVGNKQSQLQKALADISPALGNSYLQVLDDIEKSSSRISWAGTAHEIRELLVQMLRTLAPDSLVTVSPGYKQEPQTSGPTQAQRVTFILQNKRSSTDGKAMLKKLTKLDETIADLVREFYGRASDAAHRHKDISEVRKLLRYFEAFAHDILDLD